jgi:hypothetical protein
MWPSREEAAADWGEGGEEAGIEEETRQLIREWIGIF